jgi:hypothetical protein
MKNSLIFCLCVFLVFGCSQIEERYEQIKFKHLKIQTELTAEEKKYYENLHQKISSSGKYYAVGGFPVSKGATCNEFKKMFEEIKKRPFSRERERERKRERDYC